MIETVNDLNDSVADIVKQAKVVPVMMSLSQPATLVDPMMKVLWRMMKLADEQNILCSDYVIDSCLESSPQPDRGMM